MDLSHLYSDIKKASDPLRAEAVSRFFKTGKGEYGEGDVFVGLTVPQSRVLALTYKELPLSDVKKLLISKVHEERLIALLLLVHNFKKGDKATRKEIYDLYLSHTQHINNWDLVDLSAEYIVGMHLFSNPSALKILTKLAHSELIWDRRIAIMATFHWIKKGTSDMTFTISDILLHDNHDLIQKAVGWMVREVGKRVSDKDEEAFLKPRYKTMPRTMLRYAIERFPKEKRKRYLLGKI